MPGGLLRNSMKQVEKMAYLEIRMMLLTLDALKATRRLGQDLEAATDFEEMKHQGIKICNEFISARLRFRDVPKVSMTQIQADWEKVARDAAECNIDVADKELEKLNSLQSVDPSQITAWTTWKEEINKLKQICWPNEIERFQVIGEIAA